MDLVLQKSEIHPRNRSMARIRVLDAILDLGMQNRLGIAMIGLAVVAVGLVMQPVIPEWLANNRAAAAATIIGGIVLTLAAAILEDSLLHEAPSEFIWQETRMVWFLTAKHASAAFAGCLLGEASGTILT